MIKSSSENGVSMYYIVTGSRQFHIGGRTADDDVIIVSYVVSFWIDE